ncbi:family 78 glycoside hydrolase catalytic domain [Mediterraneibacter sp. NSJ-55]|uniref:alpha-L-rhamnosidase n=1 Tax=Mediterraneibacter hominis TaxID=2763054 RepID=A0A923RQU6_9FIRM|nr:alpha-L-rhamnosidase [Mediterraneibacter hominis]MBC5689954.1 family 78 glycoside hydrolase catalytic domain [Mediterraneibacter hominis]
MIEVKELRVNNQVNPVGIGKIEVVGWKLVSSARNVRQKMYEIQIAEDRKFSCVIYDSGEVESRQSVHIQIEESGLFLRSAEMYFIRVRVSTEQGEKSKWKEGCFTTAFLHNQEWKAVFISPENERDWNKSKGYYLRKEIQMGKKVKRAFAFTTALGLYHFYINGHRIGEDEFTPGWTSYHHHLLYQSYDVTRYIKEGANMLGAHIGAGWYKGDMGSARTRNHYGKQSAFLCQIEVLYEDGERVSFCTDTSWESTESPILYSEIYDGEIYDARKEIDGWNEAGNKNGEWEPVEKVVFPIEALRAQSGCKVKKMKKVPAKRIFQTPQGDWVVDFGQNLAGWIEFQAEGSCGDKVELNCFEVLDKDGNVYLDNLRTAKATVTYICKGGKTVFQPNFSFQGFQYAKIASYPGIPQISNFTAYVLYSDMQRTGEFCCSNKDLNQLHHNILWGMRSNFLDVPTDCPQRDERLGWTGDAQIFCRAASYLMDTDTFFRKWLIDVAAEQTQEGGIPHVVPDVWSGKNVKGKIFERGTHSAAAWADAVVIIPWTLYLMYGDKRVIEQQYSSMKSWIDFMGAHAKDCMWEYRMQFGDWVALDAKEGSYYGATPLELTNMAYYAYSTELFSRMAHVTGNEEDAQEYGELHKKIKDAYRRHFFTSEGRLNVQTQTAQIVSLFFHLVPEEFKQNVVDDLLHLLKERDGHLVTGFVGTPYFCQVLSDNGHAKEAYELLLKEDFPSWLYQVKQGATTVWEHWDGKKPDGSMWSPAMNSFNHYAYGAVGEWLYRGILGIECSEQEPGFQRILLKPHIGGGLEYAEGSYESIYGRIVSRWERKKERVKFYMEIPDNTTAEIWLYNAVSIEYTGGINFEKIKVGIEKGYRAETGSGSYEIQFSL